MWSIKSSKLPGRLQAHNQEILGVGEVSRNRGTSIKVSCMTYKRRAPQGEMLVFFQKDTLRIAF